MITHTHRCNHDLKVALIKEVWDDRVKEEMTKKKITHTEASKSVKIVWMLGNICLVICQLA